jgi:hypothetical protein
MPILIRFLGDGLLKLRVGQSTNIYKVSELNGAAPNIRLGFKSGLDALFARSRIIVNGAGSP